MVDHVPVDSPRNVQYHRYRRFEIGFLLARDILYLWAADTLATCLIYAHRLCEADAVVFGQEATVPYHHEYFQHPAGSNYSHAELVRVVELDRNCDGSMALALSMALSWLVLPSMVAMVVKYLSDPHVWLHIGNNESDNMHSHDIYEESSLSSLVMQERRQKMRSILTTDNYDIHLSISKHVETDLSITHYRYRWCIQSLCLYVADEGDVKSVKRCRCLPLSFNEGPLLVARRRRNPKISKITRRRTSIIK